MQRPTTKQFIEKAKLIHNDKYDYSKFIYINNRIKGIIICNKCKNEFTQSSANHLKGKGCPKCNHKIGRQKQLIEQIKENGSLLDNNPELCKDWIYEKNFPLTPDQVLGHSGKRVWWRCFKCDGEWQAKICNRTTMKTNCPYCCNFHARVLKGFNDLETLRPDLVKDWDYEKNGNLKPDQFIAQSQKKVHWICSKNKDHKWEASISKRSNGNNCPKCLWKNQEKVCEIFEQIFKVEFRKKRFYCFIKMDGKKSNIEFDGYNEELKIAFEYQGYQHYIYPNFFHKNKLQFQKQRSKDLFKQQFCLTNNIKLVIIPYWIKEKDFKKYIKGNLRIQ